MAEPRPEKKQRVVKSKIWNFFTQDLDENTAECNICAKVYAFKPDSKGRNPGTNTLFSHLQRAHSDVQEVSDILEDRTKNKETQIPTNKQTITQMLKAKGANPMPKDGAESVRLHRAILEMITIAFSQ